LGGAEVGITVIFAQEILRFSKIWIFHEKYTYF
jgi:hypothetical protein